MSEKVRGKFWLADPYLTGVRGHHQAFNSALAAEVSRRGWKCAVVTGPSSDAAWVPGWRHAESFREDWRRTPAPIFQRHGVLMRWLEGISRRRFRRDLERVLPASILSGDDVVLAQMLAPRHVLSWFEWLLARPKARRPTLVFHLGYDSRRFQAAAADIRNLSAVARREGARVRWVSDCADLAEDYAALFSEEVTSVPHVVTLPKALSAASCRGVPRVVVLGNARRDKGFVEIVDLLEGLRPRLERGEMTFRIQGNDPDAGSREAVRRLAEARYPGVDLFMDPLPEASYWEELQNATIVLLPYRQAVYARRTSGVFCEALCLGKPTVTTAETWMNRFQGRRQLGWTCPDRDAHGLRAVVERACVEAKSAADRSERAADDFRRWFSAARFLDLVEEAIARP